MAVADVGVHPEPPHLMHSTVELATGVLRIRVDRADLPLAELCDFATRMNPRRGFLFVSKVLGRHLPARPSVMRDSQRRLAARLPASLPGPVVIIGLAETAVALGQGVHAEFVARTGRDDVLYLQTTRYALDRAPAMTFEEEHSHAPRHLLHQPAAPADRALLRSARSLVIVDDEASTGRTLVNVARAFARIAPGLERSAAVVLTDWRPEPDAEVEVLSLLRGSYEFSPRADAPPVEMPRVAGDGRPRTSLLPRNYGRLGLRRPPVVPPELVRGLDVAPGARVLVLGTGEFCYLPMLIAEALEQAGADVRCQSTTRSPARLGHAIGSAMTFLDNYGDGIPNFLYNVRPLDYERVIVVYETPRDTVQAGLIDTLRATPVFV